VRFTPDDVNLAVGVSAPDEVCGRDASDALPNTTTLTIERSWRVGLAPPPSPGSGVSETLTEPLLIRAQQAIRVDLTRPNPLNVFSSSSSAVDRHDMPSRMAMGSAPHTHPAARLDRLSALLGDL